MKERRRLFAKVFIILGVLLLAAGIILFIGGMSAVGWDFSALNTVRYENRTYEEQSGSVTALQVDYTDAAIAVEYSETAEKISVSYPVRQNERGEDTAEIEISKENGVLSITEHQNWQNNLFQWNIDLDIHFGGEDNSPVVRITLPAGREYSLTLGTGNGSIRLQANGALSSLALHTENGSIRAQAETPLHIGGNATFQTENGSVTVSNIEAEGDLALHTSNGSVSAENVSAKNITVTTEHGDVTLTDAAADTALTAQTSTGRISLCGEIAANSLTAKTETGAILLRDGTIDANAIDLSTETGSITAENSVFAGAQSDYTVQVSTEIGNSNVSDSLGGNRRLSLKTTTGEIRVFFQN